MKLLNGKDLAEFIEMRQAQQVRALRQAHGVFPKLAIIVTIEHPAIDVYMRMKTAYGADLQIAVEIHRVEQLQVATLVADLNADDTVHGIIIQLPLQDPSQTDELCNMVNPAKDVDALGKNAIFEPATALAILWLLAGYNINLNGQNIVILGHGKLVGQPLEKLLLASGQTPMVVDEHTKDSNSIIKEADIIVTATGQPGVVTSELVKQGAVVVDAGVSGEQGKTVGDLSPDMYDRDDLTITPQKGGVGPLTISALFDNVIRAAQTTTKV